MKYLVVLFFFFSSFAFSMEKGERVFDTKNEAVGTVVTVIEDDLFEVRYDKGNNILIRTRVQLSKKVNSLDGFAAGDRVISTYSSKRGVILEIFENSMTVIKFDEYTKKCFSLLKHIEIE